MLDVCQVKDAKERKRRDSEAYGCWGRKGRREVEHTSIIYDRKM